MQSPLAWLHRFHAEIVRLAVRRRAMALMPSEGDSLVSNPFADEILAGYAPDAKMYEKDRKNSIFRLDIRGRWG